MDTPQPFTVSRNTIFKTLILTPSTAWILWLVVAVGLAFVVVGCIADIRWLILGLIVVLTMTPTIAFFIFVNFMFASEMVANFLHHTIERRPGSYLLHIYRKANEDEPIEAGKTWIESGSLTLFDCNIIRKKTESKYEVIYLKDSPLSILYVPRY
ncbi:MAG: hypothetical protein K2I08_00700 [Muribaculaceae bacterium]|nr:hypothetical protein [Muribaculaceae bacterium]MDE6786802.1 hypothetical protein [Muribaculaceae bacterium]